MEKCLNFKKWIPKSFNKERAIKDDPKLIFINRKTDIPFPDFKLAKKYHHISDLKIAILAESKGIFADSNLKMVQGVYDVSYLKQKEIPVDI